MKKAELYSISINQIADEAFKEFKTAFYALAAHNEVIDQQHRITLHYGKALNKYKYEIKLFVITDDGKLVKKVIKLAKAYEKKLKTLKSTFDVSVQEELIKEVNGGYVYGMIYLNY